MKATFGRFVCKFRLENLFENLLWKFCLDVCLDISFGNFVWKFCSEILFGNLVWKFSLDIFIWKFFLEDLRTDRPTGWLVEAPRRSLKRYWYFFLVPISIPVFYIWKYQYRYDFSNQHRYRYRDTNIYKDTGLSGLSAPLLAGLDNQKN